MVIGYERGELLTDALNPQTHKFQVAGDLRAKRSAGEFKLVNSDECEGEKEG